MWLLWYILEVFPKLYGGNILETFNYNEQIMIAAMNDINHLKDKVVKPYLQKLNINWETSNNKKTWDNYLNGWLSSEGIQGIPNNIKRIILLIYLNNNVMQMFFPINNTFFIKEEELESLSFMEVVESRGYDIELIKTVFEGVNINIDLTMINFLQNYLNLKK
jgi:hypothetical protein